MFHFTKGLKNHLPVGIFFSIRFCGKKILQFCFYFMGTWLGSIVIYVALFSWEKNQQHTHARAHTKKQTRKSWPTLLTLQNV